MIMPLLSGFCDLNLLVSAPYFNNFLAYLSDRTVCVHNQSGSGLVTHPNTDKAQCYLPKVIDKNRYIQRCSTNSDYHNIF